MKTTQFCEAVAGYFSLLKSLGKKITRKGNPEHIHRFRVTYKELRAVLRMCAFNSTASATPAMPRRIKKCYQIAGRIRDLQLYQPGNATLHKTVERQIKKLIIAFTGLFSKISFQKKITRITAGIPEQFPVTAYRNFILVSNNSVASIAATGIFSDETIHCIRKKLKDVFYNMRLLKKINEKEYNHIHPLQQLEALNKILKNCGNFQDKTVAIRLSKKFSNKKEATERGKWQTQKEALKKSIIAQLKKYTPSPAPVA